MSSLAFAWKKSSTPQPLLLRTPLLGETHSCLILSQPIKRCKLSGLIRRRFPLPSTRRRWNFSSLALNTVWNALTDLFDFFATCGKENSHERERTSVVKEISQSLQRQRWKNAQKGRHYTFSSTLCFLCGRESTNGAPLPVLPTLRPSKIRHIYCTVLFVVAKIFACLCLCHSSFVSLLQKYWKFKFCMANGC